jgi:mono/diheme cytochrome c family protein
MKRFVSNPAASKPAVLRPALWCMAFAAVFFSGCKATPPGKIETAVINAAKHHLTVGGDKDSNPLPATKENIDQGKHAFANYCFACHGLDGQNTGVPFADSMSPPVPPLTSPVVQSYSDGQLKWVIDNGIKPSGMPGAKGILTDEEIWSMVLYIRHLPPAGSLGEPSMYSGDSADDDAPPAAATGAGKTHVR